MSLKAPTLSFLEHNADANTIRLFGIPVRNITLEQAVCLIRDCLRRKGPSSICFVNAHCVNVAQSDAVYRQILESATHAFADGIGMRIASLLHGAPLVDNVNGTDLYPVLCRALEGTGVRVFLLGAEPGIAERVRERARVDSPGLLICGVYHGYFGNDEEAEIAATIRETGADLVLVAMGVPRQEKWMVRSLPATGAKVAIGVGALFDFYSNKFRRAPVWMRRLGLEWVRRLVQEPRRLWRRYLIGNFQFLWLAGRMAFQHRIHASRLRSSLDKRGVTRSSDPRTQKHS